MLLKHFNTAESSEIMSALRPCIDIERWAQEIIDSRPYASLGEIMARAKIAANPFTPDEVDAAMAHHPRIGERAAGSSTEAALSRKEQSAVDPSDSQITRALAEGNRAYEAKFDQVFLIRAAGRHPQEIIDILHQRLNNSAAEENLIVAGQLREIALLRLEGVMSA